MSDQLAPCFRELLAGIGEDCTRSGLQATPERAAQSFRFLTSGYAVDVAALTKSSLFDSSSTDLVLVRNIDVYSLCEHHLLPFFGRAHVAYIPQGKIIGLSKIARVIEALARRLQVQEQLTQQIADCFFENVGAAGVGVVLEATHLCMAMRGVQQTNALMRTSAVRGTFQSDPQLRANFISQI